MKVDLGKTAESGKPPLTDNPETAAENTEKLPPQSTTAPHYKHPTTPGEHTAPGESGKDQPNSPEAMTGEATTRPAEDAKALPHELPTTPTEGGKDSLGDNSETASVSAEKLPPESMAGLRYEHPAERGEHADLGESSEGRLDGAEAAAGGAAMRPTEGPKAAPREHPGAPTETAPPEHEPQDQLGTPGTIEATARPAEGPMGAPRKPLMDLPEASGAEVGDGLLEEGSEDEAQSAESLVEGAGGGSVGGGEADGGIGGRPAPPEGWYEPYVPEEDPAEGPHIVPRSDAW